MGVGLRIDQLKSCVIDLCGAAETKEKTSMWVADELEQRNHSCVSLTHPF